MLKRIASGLFMLALLLVPAACNTIEGAGEDIEAAGEGISEGAEETQREMRR